MTSGNPDTFYPSTEEEKELEMLTSIRTLKRENKKCGNEEVFRLVKDSIDSDITKEDFDRLLEILIKNQPVKRKKSKIRNTYLYQKNLYNMIKK